MIRYLWMALFCVFCGTAFCDNAQFPETIKAGDSELVLTGVGSLSRWFVKGCDIALFAGKGVKKSEILKDIPRCLEFYYYRTIKADQFSVAAWDTLRREWSEDRLKAEKTRIDKMHTIFRAVKKGDRYRLLYVPGSGTKLFLNGKELGSVNGAGFAEVYYSICLGVDPIDKKTRDLMMKGLK